MLSQYLSKRLLLRAYHGSISSSVIVSTVNFGTFHSSKQLPQQNGSNLNVRNIIVHSSSSSNRLYQPHRHSHRRMSSSSTGTGSGSEYANVPDFSGIGKLNHVAIACTDLEAASNMYKYVLKAEVSEPMELPEHGVITVFINLGNTKLELLYPLGDNSPIAGYLKKNPSGGLHHICIEVNDIQTAAEQLTGNKKRVLGDIKIGAHGLPVLFVHPKDMGGVLVELEEIKK